MNTELTPYELFIVHTKRYLPKHILAKLTEIQTFSLPVTEVLPKLEELRNSGYPAVHWNYCSKRRILVEAYQARRMNSIPECIPSYEFRLRKAPQDIGIVILTRISPEKDSPQFHPDTLLRITWEELKHFKERNQL